MEPDERTLSQLPSILKEAAKQAVPDSATVLGAVQARLSSRPRKMTIGRWLIPVIPVAVVLALLGGVLTATGAPGNAPVHFLLQLIPNRPPAIAHPGAAGAIRCDAAPDQEIAPSTAQLDSGMAVFSLSHDPAAKLIQAKYVFACDGAKSLDLAYSLNGATIEVTQGKPQSSAGPLYLNLKVSNKSQTPAQLGWTIEQIVGQEVAVHTGKPGKGYAGGIDTAMWQTRGTLIVVTGHSSSNGQPASGLARQTLEEIVMNMLPI